MDLLKQLKKNTAAYEDNYKLMRSSVGTPKHKEYVEIERALNNNGIKLREALGIRAKDPCDSRKCVNTCNINMQSGKCELLNRG